MRKLKEYYITIIMIVIVMAVNIGAFASYANNVNSRLAQQTDMHVTNLMNEAVECINIRMEEQINTVDMLSQFINGMSDEKMEEFASDFLKNQKDKQGYSVLELVMTKDGIGADTSEDYSEKSYYKSVIKGKSVVAEESDGKSVKNVVFASPVASDENEDEISAVLVAKMDVMKFYDAIELSSLNTNGMFLVVKKDGTLISKTENLLNAENISAILPDKKKVDSLTSGMRSRNSGKVEYESDNGKRYIGYSRLNFNRWYVVGIIPADIVEANISDMETDVIILGVELGFILTVLIIYLIYNITSVKKKERINMERYIFASKYADTIMFDYSVAKDTMYCNDMWKKKFGYPPAKSNVREKLKDCMSEKDSAVFNEHYEKVMESGCEEEFSIEMYDRNKKAVKCMIKFFPICPKKGKVTKIIGFIETEE